MLDTPRDPEPGQPAAGPDETTSGRSSLRSPAEPSQRSPVSRAPKRAKRKRSPLLATASGFLSFLGIAAVALVVVWSLGLQRVGAPGPLAGDKVVNIQPGNDISVVDQLADEGVIDSRALMTATLWLEGDRGNIKSGEYLFKQNASLRDVIDLLLSGKQILHAITIPEGLTSEQVVERLRDNDILLGDIANVPPEGTLMPDTFKFSRGTTRDQVVRSMEAEQRKVLAEVWSHRAADIPIHSPFELVTLASIVEKETGRADERPRVAGVFVNRLARGMPLQSDPTIVYGIVGGKGTLGRGILRSELDQRTPYNTYQIVGLPPGPIANPGKAALEAVANPARTRDLYFVADGTGGHAFAENLVQHQQNVQRWRQIEKDAKDKVSPDAVPSGPGLPRSNQRTDSGVPAPIVASIALDISGTSQTTPVSITEFPINRSATTGTFAPPVTVATSTRPTFDELDVEVAGIPSRSDPATWDTGGVDGIVTPAPDPANGSMQSFPVSPRVLADQRARALAYGAFSGGSSPAALSAEESAVSGPAPDTTEPSHLYGKGRVIDASEGTALDPLKDHSYDLNSAKVVPAIKPLPPIPRLTSN